MITLTQKQKYVVEKYHSGAKQDNKLTLVSLNISDNI